MYSVPDFALRPKVLGKIKVIQNLEVQKLTFSVKLSFKWVKFHCKIANISTGEDPWTSCLSCVMGYIYLKQ